MWSLAHSYYDAERFGRVKTLSKTRNLPLLYVFVLVFALFNVALCEPTDSSIPSKAVSYLVASYNRTLHLCPEVHGHSELGRRYWICSDNLLAYYALQKYNKTISDEIKAEIIEYATNYSLPTNSERLPISYKHESVIGDVLPPDFHGANNYYIINASDYTIITEINNGPLTSNWQVYADLLAFRGLSLVNEGRIEEANAAYNEMMKMWDNYGFADAAHNDTYATYKLALAIILRKALNLTKPTAENQMVNVIEKCQKSDGGVITDYNKELKPVGLVNTETTALIIIAETGESPPIPENVNILLLETAISVTTIVIIAKAAKARIIKSKNKF